MAELNSLVVLLINIISIPFQLYKQLVWAGLDFVAFDVLQLGS